VSMHTNDNRLLILYVIVCIKFHPLETDKFSCLMHLLEIYSYCNFKIFELYIRRGKTKRLLGNQRPRWEDNVMVDLQEVDGGGGGYTGLICLRIGTGGYHL
jgi:hypothetical protein